MAMLWKTLREEVMGTVDDFRQKGAIGALRDAALDARDMATGVGSALIDGVQDLVGSDEVEQHAAIRSVAAPVRGAAVQLEFADGRVAQAVVVDVDSVSQPPRAQVTVEGLSEPLLVPVLPPGVPLAGQSSEGPSLLDMFKSECQATVQEFREKGAVGALKDATLDAVDLVGSTAKSAASTAQSATSEVVQEFREKGAVGALKDATLDAVDIVGSTAKCAASGAASLASPLIDLDAPTEESANTTAASGAGSGILDGLKQELNATVQDFREKGAVGALKDATLDAVDMVGSTAKSAASGAMSLASPLIDLDTPAEGSATAPAGAGNGILDGLKQELNATVQDFREKGAIGAMKDATLDAADMVGGAATAVVGKAQELAFGSEAAQADAAPASSSASTAAAGAAMAAAGAAGAVAASSTTAAGVANATAEVPRSFAPPSRAEAAKERPAEVAKPEAAAAAAAAAPPSQARPETPKAKPAAPKVAVATTPPPAAGGSKAATPSSGGEGPESFCMATPRVVAAPAGPKMGSKSLVEMRRSMFEKPKPAA